MRKPILAASLALAVMTVSFIIGRLQQGSRRSVRTSKCSATVMFG